MIQWKYFPTNRMLPETFQSLLHVFQKNEASISSDSFEYSSDEVLRVLRNDLLAIGFDVEKSKAKADKIRVPVLFGEQGKEDLAFEADGYWAENEMVLEVEAGRAVVNYQFLKDFFQACMMYNVRYLCIAVRKTYRNGKDYEKVCRFFDAMYSSNRIQTQLEGILIVGY
ncbi:hypothetical protein LJC56_09105 [Christensenellaceae bacterium OttesenSCG-928-K19]|nr:hypothetical protein [Christensenellaceae bacterium OttesenSCG-928-K19]